MKNGGDIHIFARKFHEIERKKSGRRTFLMPIYGIKKLLGRLFSVFNFI